MVVFFFPPCPLLSLSSNFWQLVNWDKKGRKILSQLMCNTSTTPLSLLRFPHPPLSPGLPRWGWGQGRGEGRTTPTPCVGLHSLTWPSIPLKHPSSPSQCPSSIPIILSSTPAILTGSVSVNFHTSLFLLWNTAARCSLPTPGTAPKQPPLQMWWEVETALKSWWNRRQEAF